MSAYRFDGYRLDVERRLLIAGDRVIPLSAKAFGVLHCLVRSAGRTVTKDELISEVWQYEDTSDATVVQHILIVRKLLEDRASSHKYILTVPRKGYQFIPRVTYDVDLSGTPKTIAMGDVFQRGEPRVWREYFIASNYFQKRDRGSLSLALQHYNAALSVDGTFAPALMGIAGTYANMAFYAFTTWEKILPAALTAITAAIKLDRTSALAHCVLAQIQLAQWDVEGARRSLELAGNLDGQSAAVHQLQSFFQAWRGETESAIASARRAVAVAPGDIATHGTFASALALQGDFQNAIDSYSQILEVEPACIVARQGRCEAYVAAGQLYRAKEDVEHLPRTGSNLSRLACIDASLGDEVGASRSFKELERRAAAEYIEPHVMAQAHIALGHYDAAVRLTERAIANHDLLFPTMLSSPLLHKPMQDRRLRRMFSEVRKSLCRANGVRTG